MGKIAGTSIGHGHSCRKLTSQDWIISWYYDYFPKGVRWRASRKVSRNTNEKGAIKFCKKWNIKVNNQKVTV